MNELEKVIMCVTFTAWSVDPERAKKKISKRWERIQLGRASLMELNKLNCKFNIWSVIKIVQADVVPELLNFITCYTRGQVSKFLCTNKCITWVTTAFSWTCLGLMMKPYSRDSDIISSWVKKHNMSYPYNDTRWEFLCILQDFWISPLYKHFLCVYSIYVTNIETLCS